MPYASEGARNSMPPFAPRHYRDLNLVKLTPIHTQLELEIETNFEARDGR